MSRVVTDYEAYLFGEGRWLRAWEKMGARPATIDGRAGYSFVVWAPNARAVSVVGEFNGWNPGAHPLQSLGVSGLWETFVPDVREGALYKFHIQTAAGPAITKMDPFGLLCELPPQTASVTHHLGRYAWRDDAWMAARREHGPPLDGPMAIYEVHAASWRRRDDDGGRSLTWRELARELVPYVRQMGFTHIELMPVMEHPFGGSWGYQVTGYFAPAAAFGTPDEFRAFVDECHLQGLGVILDWVPGHFPKDAHALAQFDGSALYEHADPRQGEHRDWGTLIFNYGRHEVRNFLLANALYWLESFHADGLRVDAVASMIYLDYSRPVGEWVPNRFGGRENLDAIDFLRELNSVTHEHVPGAVVVAEESTAFPAVSRPTWVGGLGFTLKWNMGWMHDILAYVSRDPIHRRWEHRHLTFSMLYAWNENFVLPFSHDEVVHGKRSLIDKIPGSAAGESGDAPHAVRVHVRPSRQEAAVHGRRVRPVARVEPRRAARLAAAGASAARGSPPLRRGSEPALPIRAGAVRARLRAGRVRLDRLQRSRVQRDLAHPPRRRSRRLDRRRPQLDAGPAHELPRRRPGAGLLS